MDARCLDMTACLAVITHYRSARGNAASPKNASHNGDELFPRQHHHRAPSLQSPDATVATTATPQRRQSPTSSPPTKREAEQWSTPRPRGVWQHPRRPWQGSYWRAQRVAHDKGCGAPTMDGGRIGAHKGWRKTKGAEHRPWMDMATQQRRQRLETFFAASLS